MSESSATSKLSAFCVAGTHSGCGKTTLTLGLLAALRLRGLRVQPFKCGPDYIDPGHHARAAGVVSRNLDTWMMGEAGVHASYTRAVDGADVAVIEGVMGLFDGASSTELVGSTADVCRRLKVPVVLVIDAKAMARSAAALVQGFVSFEPGLNIAGVIANRVGSERHAAIIREALAAAGLPPLLGAVPIDDRWQMESRHLGLVTATEEQHDASWFDSLADGIEKHIDVDALLACCRVPRPCTPPPISSCPPLVRLGVARDAAFQFYYEDNLDLLRAHGVECVPFSPMHDAALPADCAGLYFGGGYPEVHAEALSANAAMRAAVRQFAERNGHIFGECGGLMYLCDALYDPEGQRWDMCGALPGVARMGSRLRRLGYAEAVTLQSGLFGEAGKRVRGHEFHWSEVDAPPGIAPAFDAKLVRGGCAAHGGLHSRRVWASYLHVHFASAPSAVQGWAEALQEGEGM